MKLQPQELQPQIDKARQTIKSDSYSISIGELISQYDNNEIEIHPEFQRLFRWSLEQKSRLIETILLGIPLPSIFVMQRQDQVWEVIDGLQRISTILEFVGKLKSPDGNKVAPSKLLGTEYLPGLKGIVYESDKPGEHSFTPEQRLALRRAKINVTILLPESDIRARGELFDRLNSGSSQATAQEVRYARFVMEDRAFAEKIKALSTDKNFTESISLTERLTNEAYDVELVCRFIAIADADESELAKINSIEDFLNTRLLRLIEKANSGMKEKASTEISAPRQNLDSYARLFKRTFAVISKSIGEDAFRRFDSRDKRFKGAFSVSAFEFVTCGIAENIDYWEAAIRTNSGIEKLVKKIELAWSKEEFRLPSGRGQSASNRLKLIVPFAREYFSGVDQ